MITRIATAARSSAWSRADVVWVGVVAALVYVLHGFQGQLTRDLGVFVYGGERVAHGVPPYVANFNTVGPLADLIPGVATAAGHLVGLGPVLAPRLLAWLLSTVCCVLVCVLARRVTGSRAAGLLAAALFLPFGSFLNLATDGPREKTAMVLFLVAALIQLTRHRFTGAGVLTALATLTWQPALLPLLAAGGTAAALTPRRLRSAALFLGGGAAAAAVAAAAFAAAGALPRALEAFVVANVLWVHQPSAFTRPVLTWHLLWHGYGITLLPALLGPVVLLVIALRRRTTAFLPLAAGGVGAVAWTAAVINGAPDLFVVLPFGAVGTAVLVHALSTRLAPRSPHVRLTLVAGVCAAAVLGAAVTAVTTRHERLFMQTRDVRAVLASAPRGSALAAIDAPQALALSGRVNPTPFLILDPGEVGYLDHTVPGGMAGYLKALVDRNTPLLAVGRSVDPRLVDRVVRERYQRAGPGPGWDWWVARDLGPRVDRRVDRATLRVMAASRADFGA